MTTSNTDYKGTAIKLWEIIDDIDTYSDMAKSDDKLFRSLVERKQKERFKMLTSDGYNLFTPEGEQVTDEQGDFMRTNSEPVEPNNN